MSALNYGSVLQSLLNSLKPPSMAQLTNPMQGLMAANKANSQRGQGILQLLSQQGGAAMADNQANFQNQVGNIQQQMMNKGLANTSVGNNLEQEAQNNLDLNNNRVQESTADALARMAQSFSQAGPDPRSFMSQTPSSGGRIINGPDTGFGGWRPFGG